MDCSQHPMQRATFPHKGCIMFRPMHRTYITLLDNGISSYDADELLQCLKELLRVERAWLPEREGYSLYIRPFMFSSGHSIGIGRPTSTTIAIMLSPVGPYFQTGTPGT